jgi:glycosyltransferase involved in cell wall biosynthesis
VIQSRGTPRTIRRLLSVFKRRVLRVWLFFFRLGYASLHNWTHSNKNALVILDDLFPWLGTGFRVIEFNEYLKVFNQCRIYSSNVEYDREKRLYDQRYPEYSDRILRFDPHIDFKCSLIYIVFLHNAHNFLPIIERYEVPFIVELYPGGYFELDEEVSDKRLSEICHSRFLRKIIVTQPIIRSYLLDRNFCSEDKILYIYGGLVNVPENLGARKCFGKDKQTFDVCFTAYKNMPLGENKGYDVFIQVAQKLLEKRQDFYFHVVGTFDENDIDVSDMGDHIRFYGPRLAPFFQYYYLDKDIILQPNKPFVLGKGAFEVVPTGTGSEAGACGVAMFCTDPLNTIKGTFDHGKDIVIVSPKPEGIVDEILHYYNNPDKLYQISRAGRDKIRKILDINKQMSPRVQLIRQFLENDVEAEDTGKLQK